MNNKITKEKIRQDIKLLKNKHTLQQLISKSEEVFSVLEILGEFQQAKNIFIYHSLKDEVFTLEFINKWKHEKKFYLPIVEENNLVFREFKEECTYTISSLGVKEPRGNNFTDYHKADLIIIPGIAFDRKMNRLGRGKGFYDRFLPKLAAKKIGICFDFQLVDYIPCQPHDIKMDMVISENEILW